MFGKFSRLQERAFVTVGQVYVEEALKSIPGPSKIYLQ